MLGVWIYRKLKVVTGAYRATPLYYVESEAFVPPLDLYLSYCSARTFQLLEANSIAASIRAATDVSTCLPTRPYRDCPDPYAYDRDPA
ncbi:hypothetical protein L249_7450 [Ophiocordyceps polyrhachis-furcata BCC 54312]|uniref:Uncharacterized protein n=1 Tax=Ophiocordyceps polyrhachis-furcata BCC 54312 TaxID=1330021 RepID=A0A367L9G6_9HYPO|nr:hypothetical protein L249_7450 [Ophiocordyceps polyrhachis-furcata BCC 54312]